MNSIPPLVAPDQKERIVIIDLVRTLSIALVLAVHLGIARFGQQLDKSPMDGILRAWHIFGRNGSYGVSLFFVLSGFLITRILMASCADTRASISLREFYSRRAGRIFPLLALVCFVSIVMPEWFPTRTNRFATCFQVFPTTSGGYASIALFLFNWYRIWHSRIAPDFGYHLGVLWSLSVEEQFYVAYPLLLKKCPSMRHVTAVLAFFITLGPVARWLAYRASPTDLLLGSTNSFAAFDQIAIGCLLFFTYKSTRRYFQDRKWLSWVLLSAGLFLMMTTYVQSNPAWLSHLIFTPSLLGLGLFLFLWGGLQFDIKPTYLTNVLCFPGQLSYGIYLLHATTLYFFWNLLNLPSPWLAFGLFLVFCSAIGYVSYRFYERPANYWVRTQCKNLLFGQRV